MKIDVRPVAKEIGSIIKSKLEFSAENVGISGETEYDLSDLMFEGTVRRADDRQMILMGTVKGKAAGNCARCFKPTTTTFEGNVDAVFKLKEDAGTKTKAEFEADPEEYYYYEGFALDISKALKDSLILSVPIRVLCQDECKGLCSKCGKDRNSNECSCESGNEDSPFAKLKNLL